MFEADGPGILDANFEESWWAGLERALAMCRQLRSCRDWPADPGQRMNDHSDMFL